MELENKKRLKQRRPSQRNLENLAREMSHMIDRSPDQKEALVASLEIEELAELNPPEIFQGRSRANMQTLRFQEEDPSSDESSSL